MVRSPSFYSFFKGDKTGLPETQLNLMTWCFGVVYCIECVTVQSTKYVYKLEYLVLSFFEVWVLELIRKTHILGLVANNIFSGSNSFQGTKFLVFGPEKSMCDSRAISCCYTAITAIQVIPFFKGTG